MKNFFLLLLFLLISVSSQAQLDSVFWFVAPEVAQNGTSLLDRPIKLNISSFSNNPINIKISQPANPLFSPIVDIIPANGHLSIDLTSKIDMIENKPADAILPYGLLIQANGLVNVYYGVIVLVNGNIEMYSLKGKRALGTNFMIPGQTEYSNNSPLNNPPPLNRIDIVATENNTVVSITPSKGIVGHVANVAFTKNLNAGETYSCVALGKAPADHLEGTIITSDKPIAVTLTDDILYHPGTGSDLVGEQIVPINNVGREYIAIKGNLDANADKVYVLATENNTSIYVSGNTVSVTTINKGQTHVLAFPAGSKAMYFTANQPVYAFQLTGMDIEFGGTLLPSIECTGSKQVKYLRETADDLNINICVPASGINSFLFNGTSSVITASDFSPVSGTSNQWYYASKNIPLSLLSQNTAMTITNTVNFHLGVFESKARWWCSYAFFSDYGGQYTTDIYDTVCPNTAYTKHGFNIPADSLQTAGTIERQYVKPNPIGCDTVIKLKLTVTPLYGITIYDTVCPNTAYTKNNFNIPADSLQRTGTFKFSDTILSTTGGCDTVIILSLNVASKDTTEFNITICEGHSYTQNGFNHSESGTYIDTLQNRFGCDSIVILHLSVVKPPDTVIISASICEGETYTKNGFSASKTGIYEQKLQNYAGCDSITVLDLTVNPTPDIEIVAVTDNFCEKDFIELEVLTNGDNILWSTGSTENPITITKSGTYTATAYLGDCKETASYFVDECPCYVWLPNAFTPNNDGLNETFKPYISCFETMKDYKFFIYDRWGNIVFKSFDYAIGWDGTDGKGKVYTSGAYSCVVDFTTSKDKHVAKNGAVTVVR